MSGSARENTSQILHYLVILTGVLHQVCLNPPNSAVYEPNSATLKAVKLAHVRVNCGILIASLQTSVLTFLLWHQGFLTASLRLGGDRQGKAACKQPAHFQANQSAAAGTSDGAADRKEPVRCLAAKVLQHTQREDSHQPPPGSGISSPSSQ